MHRAYRLDFVNFFCGINDMQTNVQIVQRLSFHRCLEFDKHKNRDKLRCIKRTSRNIVHTYAMSMVNGNDKLNNDKLICFWEMHRLFSQPRDRN